MILVSGPALEKVDRNSEIYKNLSLFHQRIALKDPLTWGIKAQDEASVRLNWVDLPSTSRDLLPGLDALSAKFRSLPHVVLCGMGGSSLAPEVIARSYGKTIFILSLLSAGYWIISKVFNVYASAFVSAVFELLWLPMLLLTSTSTVLFLGE